ncbi:tRNA delta(2)-isopentenylpyrophosphate transferase [Alicyclobacillus hesperidum URH17-3-68]|nr:tRNA delta(2)-isopentenylpyrophosphate transferase [Alicyclobacillus hesperidum URH17-3-68]
MIGAAAPEIAGAAIGGAAVGYVADFVDHFGQNMGWWKN